MSSSVPPLAPPPPGQVTNYVDPPTLDPALIAVNVVGLSICTVLFLARIATRTLILKSFGTDDALAILSYCLVVASSGIFLNTLNCGFGRHIWDIPETDYVSFTYWGFVDKVVLMLVYAAIKATMLESYRRVFSPNKLMSGLCVAGTILITLCYAAQLIEFFFVCSPVAKNWDPTVPGECSDDDYQGPFQGAFNTATDLFILFLPMPFIWNLKMSRMRRLRVMALLSVGASAVAMSAARLAWVTHCTYDDVYDSTYCVAILSIFGELEIYIGFCCACTLVLPASARTVKKHLGNVRQSLSVSKRSTVHKMELKFQESGSSGSETVDRPVSTPPQINIACISEGVNVDVFRSTSLDVSSEDVREEQYEEKPDEQRGRLDEEKGTSEKGHQERSTSRQAAYLALTGKQ